MAETQEKYWLNSVLDTIESTYPEGEIVVSSGISPSGSYHIGNFREILSADMVKVGLEMRGRQIKHLHIVDNYDPLRRRYDFLPEEYEKYVGWPVVLVPDPWGCHESYGDHFFNEFYRWVPKLNIQAEVIDSYRDLYLTGQMAPQIEKAVAQAPEIRRIFKEVSHRDLPEDWMPLQILSDDNSFNKWRFVSIDTEKKEIHYQDEQGNEDTLPYNTGRVKLNWRLDWPARWDLLSVQVEPHGFQEHGASGGSFETGKRFVKEVFGSDGPIAGFQYGHMHLAGDKIKMSSSLGNLITLEQGFAFMPPEVLRYIYARYPGKKRIDFDPGAGFARLMDEFSEVDRAVRAGQDHEFAPAYKIAVAGQETPGTSSVPFNHLVMVVQAARSDEATIIERLKETGYAKEADEQLEPLKREIGYVQNWLQNWAPEESKFELQQQLPQVNLTDQQKALLAHLADAIAGLDHNENGQWYHDQIHAAREAVGNEPAEAFKAIYQVLLGKDAGPRAG